MSGQDGSGTYSWSPSGGHAKSPSDLHIMFNCPRATFSCPEYRSFPSLRSLTGMDAEGLQGLTLNIAGLSQSFQPLSSDFSPSTQSGTPLLSPTSAGSPTLSHSRSSINSPGTPTDSRGLPRSPARARSMNDLLAEMRKPQSTDRTPDPEEVDPQIAASFSPEPEEILNTPSMPDQITFDESPRKEVKEKDPSRWSTLEDLIDKALFLSVTASDAAYITHFLLTYRRFATPRGILLGMQRRIRSLDLQNAKDPVTAGFAQMRICRTLDLWIQSYPSDFAVPGTHGALEAVVKSIMGKTHLLHYASTFKPFLDSIPSLEDRDAVWAVKLDCTAKDEDDAYRLTDDEEAVGETVDPVEPAKESRPNSAENVADDSGKPQAGPSASTEIDTPQKIIRELVKTSHGLEFVQTGEIAEELTRLEADLFLAIDRRDWLYYTFVSGKKDPERDPVARFNYFSNRIADWVASLILCHDKPRTRAKQIAKFVEIARALREMKNYCALRSFVAGINVSTFEEDVTLELFKKQWPGLYKLLLSYDVLLQQMRSHQAYRLALKHTEGACLPALEVHISDLFRAHEGNPDFDPNDRNVVHWAKFHMLGRFVDTLVECQNQCRRSSDYRFSKRPYIRDMLMVEHLMDPEMQQSRLAPPDLDAEPTAPKPYMTLALVRDVPVRKESAFLRKWFPR